MTCLPLGRSVHRVPTSVECLSLRGNAIFRFTTTLDDAIGAPLPYAVGDERIAAEVLACLLASFPDLRRMVR